MPTPTDSDRRALETKRARLAAELDAMAHTRRAFHAGRATRAMMEKAAAHKYLLRVLDGPVPDRARWIY